MYVEKTTLSVRHDWSKAETLELLQQPFNDLIFNAQQTHRLNFDPNKVQLSTLMNIKTGGCPEDCAYCPQSAHYKTGVGAEKIASVEEVVSQAKAAKNKGATRFCMGAAWRQPKKSDLEKVVPMVKAVKEMQLETCLTLGMLTLEQARTLKASGLDYYNHNIDTSPEYYSKIISTRDYRERLTTLEHVRNAGINVCCGGIIGMGEAQKDRAGLLLTLANMPNHPESVPINMLVKVEGTPLDDVETADPIEFIRTIAAARIMMPKSYIRLSAGRNSMSDETQALCYLAGANSIFYGEKLLTTDNPQLIEDRLLLKRLGIQPNKNR
ncbi:MAG TPA: biotin synthase BioB [Gammaproteobacteria bacterium]|nr:biotin synthase BioB [Gammaproteobacteria bacterium]|tara:strand:- start:3568 stop:4539 length:972 start_codon:yes stop_codon:yes gene_type:complete